MGIVYFSRRSAKVFVSLLDHFNLRALCVDQTGAQSYHTGEIGVLSKFRPLPPSAGAAPLSEGFMFDLVILFVISYIVLAIGFGMIRPSRIPARIKRARLKRQLKIVKGGKD